MPTPSSISRRRLRLAILWSLVTLNAVGILLAGLNTRGVGRQNDAEWAPNGPGIVFGEHGLAYTDPFSTQTHQPHQAGLGFTMEVVLRLDERADRGFRFVAVIHSGDDRAQFLIAQWRQTIIVMNGDDYDHRQRLPRLSATISELDGDPFFLAVTSDSRGSALYIDGARVASHENVTFQLPTDHAPGRLVLGNSVYGDSSWHGRILGIALHGGAVDESTLHEHLELWRADRGFIGSDYATAALSYPLSERTGREASNRSAHENSLRFPPETSFLTPKLFTGDINTFSMTPMMTWDVVINLFGFMPLGCLVLALATRATRLSRRSALSVAIAVGLILSFGIETAQGWMPSRSSSPLDLLLNIMGTGLGSGVFLVAASPWGRERRPVARRPSKRP